jgi:hypothetical protein
LHDEAKIDNDLIYAIYYTCEELLEMIGIAIFLYALLEYIMIIVNKFTLVLKRSH